MRVPVDTSTRGRGRSLLAWWPIVALGLVSVAAAEPASTPEERESAQKAVFLLQYVASDYAGAVRGGKVIDDGEYRENAEFAASAGERLKRLRAGMPDEVATRVRGDLERLRAMIADHAEPAAVRVLVQEVIPLIVGAFGLEPAPLRRPDTAHAAALYRENCVPCHGSGGRGDGPRAKELDPAPADFSDPVRMDAVAPYVFFNALTLGVEGTAMASFRDAFSDDERWGLAFYVWTFRNGTDPEAAAATAALPTISLSDLATRPATELAAEVARSAAASGSVAAEGVALRQVALLRAHPDLGSTPGQHLHNARAGIVRALEGISAGDFEAAADRVTTAYLEDFEPLEAEIDRRDATVRRDFERALLDFRAALRAGDAAAARAIAGRLEAALDAAGRLFDAAPSANSNLPVELAVGVAAALSMVAGLVLLWRGGGIGKDSSLR